MKMLELMTTDNEPILFMIDNIRAIYPNNHGNTIILVGNDDNAVFVVTAKYEDVKLTLTNCISLINP